MSRARTHKKHNGGFTLIEAVVAFALASLLFAALVGVIAPAYRMYRRARENADAQMIAGNILDTIRTSAITASELTADSGGVHIGTRKTFSSDNGRLYFNDTPVYDKKYYNGKNISLFAEPVGENIIRVTVTVEGEDMVPATATAVIAPIRLILGEEGDLRADSELNKAGQLRKNNPTSTADSLFHDLYNDGAGGNSGFEGKSVFEIISKTRLLALKAEAEAAGLTAEAAFFDALLTKTYYLAIYFAENTPQVIAYLTDVESSVQNANNPAYFVYWGNNWYMRNPILQPSSNVMGLFNDMSEESIVNYLNAGDNFILAANVSLPLPGA